MVPENIKHSSYTYQKLFRGLYGYTQNVSKSNGKAYKYHRKGVLSGAPYLRAGKNCVIIPTNQLSSLIEFFKTGKNPSHHWFVKGDWKAVYYMNEKDLPAEKLVLAVEGLLDRTYIATPAQSHQLLENEVSKVASNLKSAQSVDENHKKSILTEAQRITSFEWFSLCSPKSDRLKKFASLCSIIRGH